MVQVTWDACFDRILLIICVKIGTGKPMIALSSGRGNHVIPKHFYVEHAGLPAILLCRTSLGIFVAVVAAAWRVIVRY